MKNLKFIFLIYITFIKAEQLNYNKYFNAFPTGSKNKYSYKSNDNLYFIFSMFRHGVRVPMDKKLINGVDLLGGKWNKEAELTSAGRKQHYQIGEKNKMRYSGFLNANYDPKEIIVYSTNTNRTISSAQSQLLGLFSKISYKNESGDDSINTNIPDIGLNNIIPPVLLFKENKNKKFNLLFKRNTNKFDATLKYGKYCTSMNNLIKKNYEIFENNSEIDIFIYEFNKKYGDVLKLEFNINYLTNRKELKGFCDAFISNYFDDNNKYILEKLLKKGLNITHLLYECYYYHGYYLFEIDGNGYAINNSIVSMSIPMRHIIDIMNHRKTKNNSYINYEYPKFILVSTHDTSLAMIQLFLKNAFKNRTDLELDYPYLGSNIIIELRKHSNNFFVEVYLNDYLKLNVTLEEFGKKIIGISFDEKTVINYCFKKKYNIDNDTLLLLILFVVFIINVIIFIYLSKYCCLNIKKNNNIITTSISFNK